MFRTMVEKEEYTKVVFSNSSRIYYYYYSKGLWMCCYTQYMERVQIWSIIIYVTWMCCTDREGAVCSCLE